MRWFLLVTAMILTFLAPGAHMSEANESQTSQTEKSILAHITLSEPAFTVETVPDMQVNFSLKNIGKQNIDPEIKDSELVVDGKIYKDSAFLFGNGPRDSRFSNLPPGDQVEFSCQLGHLFSESGEHLLAWRGKHFNAVQIKFNVAKVGSPWKIIAKNAWAQVSTERAAYKSATSKRFFMHVNIKNATTKPIGFQCGDRFQVFYPNQWVESQIARRQIISEMRHNQNALTANECKQIIRSFHDVGNKTGSETMIKLAPGASYEYFISFNSGEYEQLQKRSKFPYAIIVMDGRMGLTDGKQVSTLRRDNNDFVMGEVPLETPVQLRTMPPSANVPFAD